MDEGCKQNREVHVIHLGDVYYAGLTDEYDRKMLAHWPMRADETAKFRSWCLNGNHDMYSGGYGYFERLLANPVFGSQRGFSCFSLENQNWMLIALDTSYDPADELGMRGDLSPDQAAWANGLLDRGATEGKKGILLTPLCILQAIGIRNSLPHPGGSRRHPRRRPYRPAA